MLNKCSEILPVIYTRIKSKTLGYKCSDIINMGYQTRVFGLGYECSNVINVRYQN